MRRIPRSLRISRIATAAMLLLIPAAHAAPITYEFSGTTSNSGLGGANVPAGTPFSGSFTYDPELPAIDTSALSALFGNGDPNQKAYGYFDPIQMGPAGALAANVDFGGLMSYNTTNATMRNIQITNDPGSPPAQFVLSAQNPDGQWISIYLGDPTGKALIGTDLPTTFDLAKFSETSAEYYDPNQGLVGGNITRLEAVPEPSTLAVLALGGLGLVIARKARGPK